MENYDAMDITIVLCIKLWYYTERYTMEKTMVLWKKLWYYSKQQLTMVNYSIWLGYFI